jgi:hypothetical protein
MTRYLWLCLLAIACKLKPAPHSGGTETADVIKEIEFSQAGGDLGFAQSLTISRDSVHYHYLLGAKNDTWSLDTLSSPELWNELISKADTVKFAALKSGGSNQPADGIDTRVTISMQSGKRLEVTNAQEPGNRELAPFFDQLSGIAGRYVRRAMK